MCSLFVSIHTAWHKQEPQRRKTVPTLTQHWGDVRAIATCLLHRYLVQNFKLQRVQRAPLSAGIVGIESQNSRPLRLWRTHMSSACLCSFPTRHTQHWPNIGAVIGLSTIFLSPPSSWPVSWCGCWLALAFVCARELVLETSFSSGLLKTGSTLLGTTNRQCKSSCETTYLTNRPPNYQNQH
jgi:hypothetical protein